MNPELSDSLSRLWQLNPPALSAQGGAAARALEMRYQLSLPVEFYEYLMNAAPAVDWMHESAIVLWAPDRVKSVTDEFPDGLAGNRNPEIEAEASQYLFFADYLDWCGYGYAICCSEGPNRGKIAIIGDIRDRLVAASFSEFVGLVSDDSDTLHSPVGDPELQSSLQRFLWRLRASIWALWWKFR